MTRYLSSGIDVSDDFLFYRPPSRYANDLGYLGRQESLYYVKMLKFIKIYLIFFVQLWI